jgi:hypothetical protein
METIIFISATMLSLTLALSSLIINEGLKTVARTMSKPTKFPPMKVTHYNGDVPTPPPTHTLTEAEERVS